MALARQVKETLVVDIGGTHIKFRTQRRQNAIKIDSGPKMTPKKMVAAIQEQTADWVFERVSLGYPGLVVHDAPITEPHNLGGGWVEFDYGKAFDGKPIRMLNDASMQALGSYGGGRMLFLSLGTGLGSAMVVDGLVQDLALAHLMWKKGKSYEDFLGEAALKRGRKAWLRHLKEVVASLDGALKSEYIVLGGGNAKLAEDLPNKVSIGNNENAFQGGFLMWESRSRERHNKVTST